MSNNFKNVQLGDKVYDIRYGWGVVEYIFSGYCGGFKVNFDPADPDPFTRIYSDEGKEDVNDISPTLYWTKPTITGGNK